MLIALDSIPWSPDARAAAIARSATGRESPDLPASMRFAARPVRTRACAARWRPLVRRRDDRFHRLALFEEADRLLQQPDRRRGITGQRGGMTESFSCSSASLHIAIGALGRIDCLHRTLGEVDRAWTVADQQRDVARRAKQVARDRDPLGRSSAGTRSHVSVACSY